MSTSTSVLRLPGRSFNRRSPWVLVATAAIGAAIALSVSTLAGTGSDPAPAARPAVQAPASASETSGAISSLRPFSDASFAISTEQVVPAIYGPGVELNYPGGHVQVGASADQVGAKAGYQNGRYQDGTIFHYPGGAVTIGETTSGRASNENAQVVPNCHQCR